MLDGAGTEAVAHIAEIRGSRNRVTVSVRIMQCDTYTPAPLRVRLYVAPPRAHLTGDLIRMATELGVARVTPVICERSVSRPVKSSRLEQWRMEALAAAKQSGNVFLPELDAPVPLAEALAAAGPGVLGDTESASGLPEFVEGVSCGEFGLWVGPEGGFTLGERTALLESGVRPVRLGQWILRVETAVPALLGWLLGEMNSDAGV